MIEWTAPVLNLPPFEFQQRRDGESTLVLDPQRRKWVVLTPEEWVRLHVVQFLIHERSVPRGLIAIEAELNYEGFRRRADVIVYRSDGSPVLVVECKAAHIGIDQKVVDQVARYNYALGAGVVMVTNGLEHFVIRVCDGKHEFLADLPDYRDLTRT